MRKIKRGQYTRRKKAQTQISFQFIFSIILVAVVIFVGFYVIKMFLDKAEQAKILDFTAKLKDKVSEIWMSEGASEIFPPGNGMTLNNKILYICFANISNCASPSSQDSILAQFCKNISAYSGSNYNMFFFPLNAVEKYKAPAAYEITCNEKACLEIPKRPQVARCIPVLDGQVRMRLTKENETSLIKITSA